MTASFHEILKRHLILYPNPEAARIAHLLPSSVLAMCDAAFCPLCGEEILVSRSGLVAAVEVAKEDGLIVFTLCLGCMEQIQARRVERGRQRLDMRKLDDVPLQAEIDRLASNN